MISIKKVFFWIFIIILIASISGSASALFLWTLDLSTNFRLQHPNIVYLLPVAGLIVGFAYHKIGGNSNKGNNLLLEEFHSPKDVIPFRMAPMVYISTLVSHLFGASVGREGTALQMGGSIADQFSKYFKLDCNDRKKLIIIGMSAGFASVFGTPLAGAVFALEVFHTRKIQYQYLLYSLLSAYIAHYVCLSWGISHSQFSIGLIPELSVVNIFWTINAGVIFGLVAYLFSKSSHFFTDLSAKLIKYPPLRPFIGGVIIVSLYYFFDLQKYMGLGIPTIMDSFSVSMHAQDFLIKLLLTTFTIGLGFKGGEVTPLFFIGATLGNALIWFVPLPMALLAGVGFVAVFAGATNTLFACILMGIELFGISAAPFLAIACIMSFLFSGHKSVYASQVS